MTPLEVSTMVPDSSDGGSCFSPGCSGAKVGPSSTFEVLLLGSAKSMASPSNAPSCGHGLKVSPSATCGDCYHPKMATERSSTLTNQQGPLSPYKTSPSQPQIKLRSPCSSENGGLCQFSDPEIKDSAIRKVPKVSRNPMKQDNRGSGHGT